MVLNNTPPEPPLAGAAALPLSGGPGVAGELSLDQWMAEEGLLTLRGAPDDAALGELIGKDRTTVYRIRTGKKQPSFEFIESVVLASKGRVSPNSFFRRALTRAGAAASPGGDAQRPFSSTSSSPQGAEDSRTEALACPAKPQEPCQAETRP